MPTAHRENKFPDPKAYEFPEPKEYEFPGPETYEFPKPQEYEFPLPHLKIQLQQLKTGPENPT